jgi:hypothetical protein
LQSYLDEFVFRFNRRRSRSRGLVSYRLLELAAGHDPVRYCNIGAGKWPRKIPPTPPAGRGHPPHGHRQPGSGVTGSPTSAIPGTVLRPPGRRPRPQSSPCMVRVWWVRTPQLSAHGSFDRIISYPWSVLELAEKEQDAVVSVIWAADVTCVTDDHCSSVDRMAEVL